LEKVLAVLAEPEEMAEVAVLGGPLVEQAILLEHLELVVLMVAVMAKVSGA
jgi:hypothetical protein